jgi:hypothetical protein
MDFGGRGVGLMGCTGLLVHVRPRLYSQELTAEIVDVSIEKLGVNLAGGIDLVTKRPYPNKGYHVASRKVGRRSVDGLFIEVPARIDEFTMVAHWLHSYGSIVEHIVHYKVLDSQFGAISDDTTMWYGRSEKEGGWAPRWPEGVRPTPVHYEHSMTLERPLSSERSIAVEYDLSGIACFREETFPLPTLERERVINHIDMCGKRLVPEIEHALKGSL